MLSEPGTSQCRDGTSGQKVPTSKSGKKSNIMHTFLSQRKQNAATIQPPKKRCVYMGKSSLIPLKNHFILIFHL